MDNRDLNNDSTDGRIERAKDAALGKHDSNPSVGDEIGEAAGGISGVLAGAAIGSVGGPVGTLIGGIAGALGGWWSGRAISEAASKLTHDDDAHYRDSYETSSNRVADRSYEDVRPAYHLGHVAAQNPDYANKSWDTVQGDMQRAWTPEHTKKYGEWSTMSNYASEGFSRGRSSMGTAAGTAAAGVASATANTANRVENAASETMHRAATGAEHVGNKVANAVDDMKDRVDGNPASRPGPDATDSSRRLDSR